MAADEPIITTAEELAAKLTLSPQLLALAGKGWDAGTKTYVRREMSAKDARASVYDSLKLLLDAPDEPDGWEQEQADDQIRDLARFIVKALPKEAMSPNVVKALDLRPYLQLATEQTEKSLDPTVAGDGPLVSPQIADMWKTAADADVAAGNMPYTSPGRIDPVEGITDPLAANATSIGNAVENIYGTQSPTLDLGGLRWQLGTGQTTIMSLTPEQLAAPVDVGAIAGMNAPTRSSDPRLNRRDMPSGRTQYRTSAAGAIDWMFGLSSEEVETLQKQLWNAGYFTTVEYNPQTDQMTMTDTSYEPGYANNPDTRLAWYKAVTDAVSTNRSIEQVLADKQTEFKQREQRVRDQVMQQRQASFEKELGSTRAAADKIAVDTLGRRLSTDEYVRMRQYLRDLQQPRMDDVAGRETADWMASAPDVGYTEEEFSQGVSDVLAEPRREYTNSNNWARINKSLGID